MKPNWNRQQVFLPANMRMPLVNIWFINVLYSKTKFSITYKHMRLFLFSTSLPLLLLTLFVVYFYLFRFRTNHSEVFREKHARDFTYSRALCLHRSMRSEKLRIWMSTTIHWYLTQVRMSVLWRDHLWYTSSSTMLCNRHDQHASVAACVNKQR